MASSEFDLINRYFKDLAEKDSTVICGIGDDAAIVQVPEGMLLAQSIDTLVEGVHFPKQTKAEDIAYKSLAVNLSDMAAMGAEPKWVLLSMTVPENNEEWLSSFALSFHQLASQHSLSLIGGDMSKGPLSITVQIQGVVPADVALKRAGAKEGDLIYVTGTLGDAGVGLGISNGDVTADEQDKAFFIESLNRPIVNTTAGIRLRSLANSAIDISDGLVADLGHILSASHLGAEIEMEDIPLSEAMLKNFNKETAWNYALSSGDDYQLCFTAPEKNHDEIIKQLNELDLAVTCIGRTCEEGKQISFKLSDGSEFQNTGNSYQHF